MRGDVGSEATITEGAAVALHRPVLGRAEAVSREVCALAVWTGYDGFRGVARGVVAVGLADRAGCLIGCAAGHGAVDGYLCHTMADNYVKFGAGKSR